MSRPAGKFADFFPTAPSVLQQRKSSKTAQHRSKSRADVKEEPPGNVSSKSYTGGSAGQENGLNAQGLAKNADASKKQIATDEMDLLPGDLLNGAGSASSTSTASSVFSSTHPLNTTTMSHGNSLHALTPLTNSDFSPPTTLV